MRSNLSIVLLSICLLLWPCLANHCSNKANKVFLTNNNVQDTKSEDNEKSTSPLTLKNLLPSDKDNLIIINHKYFILGYNTKHKQPAWVAWLLTKDMVENKVTKRTNNFRVDDDLPCCQSFPSDYNKSGYDKGHICPSGDRTYSKQANSSTFLMSNICPQNQKLNRDTWNDLEQWTRKQATIEDSLIIIAGPIFDTIIDTIGVNKVSVPVAFFKIIIDISLPEYHCTAFIMRNAPQKRDFFRYTTTIEEIERRTNLKFFPNHSSDTTIKRLKANNFSL